MGSSTPPHDLAAAIAHACYDGRPPMLRAIGAAAVNQAIKGCAVARQYVAPRAIDLTVKPGFATVSMPSKTRQGEYDEVSAILLKVVIE
ncbi:MAG: stage V sporulation protein S [Dermatophilaceae bacterium]